MTEWVRIMPRKRTITFGLSFNSVKRAMLNLGAFINELKAKNYDFVSRLCDIAFETIENNMITPGDSDPTHTTDIWLEDAGGIVRGTVQLNGEDVLFIEFGAGITYNGPAGQSPHPKGAQLGYTIGDYGYHLGRLHCWYYHDDNGQLTISWGTKAAMPVYKASREVRRNVKKIAKEIFGVNYKTPKISKKALHPYDV